MKFFGGAALKREYVAKMEETTILGRLMDLKEIGSLVEAWEMEKNVWRSIKKWQVVRES